MLRASWQDFLADKRNKNELIISLILLAGVLAALAWFINYVENRQGVVFADPVLNLFDPIDLTWFTFSLIYFALIIAIVSLINYPDRLLFALQLYSLMAFVRIIAMFLLPLNPPEQMIILKDPFVEFFGSGNTLTKDLFFSGHTATLFILYLVSVNKIIKIIFLINTILVAVFVLLQHVHYTIDVFAAIFFTYACYSLLEKVKHNKVNG
ncbi:MAG TPA: phosphatase PAP2-related protein [Ignavibacteriaceae bacterium]|nr:phosphatase PAP2-related protein [Ignavibacteriaceae bacterium]